MSNYCLAISAYLKFGGEKEISTFCTAIHIKSKLAYYKDFVPNKFRKPKVRMKETFLETLFKMIRIKI